MVDIAASLAGYGANPAALRLLDADGPELLPYATLLAARRQGDAALSAVGAVYEWQEAPLLFVVNADSLENEQQLHQIRRLLAMRGDAPYLGVVAPGRLDVYHIALDKHSLRRAKVEMGDGDLTTVLVRLANLRPDAAISRRSWISNVVLNLLTRSITRLVGMNGVTHEDAISLVGRALFTRFLADRDLLPGGMSAANAPGLFDHRAAAENTSRWLDTTFNGELLPLSDRIFEVLPDSAYAVLGDILRRAPGSQLFLGWEEKWDNLDFSHIPVGVLSQAYELYLREHAPDQQKREGGFYTPRPIADLMVRASFRALERNGAVRHAKVLDPAAGAGVFLLTAFRELVAGRWREDGMRPETEVLRSILYHQLTGLDVNEAALRFAALGLYLMSIELDPNPRPVDKLHFDQDLRGTVLHRLVSGGQQEGSALGSLGPLAGQEHTGQYDLVIGNPPWSSGTGLQDWHLVRSTVARIASERNVAHPAPPLPNEGLDLPFVWRAMEWAKPGGQIAFALHARLLFQQGDGMVEARQALFEALDITAVINGTELRQTKVWPEISAPFCILFATNNNPGASAGFRLISPKLEESMNAAGVMRIDALNAEMVHPSRLAETPDILKILFRGTSADLAIVERIRAQGYPTLESYWRKSIGVTERGHLWGSGNGYQRLRKSSEIRQPHEGSLPGADASRLLGLPEIDADTFTTVFIDGHRLKPFTQQRVHRIRSFELFAGPLVIVHKSPPAATGRIGIAISETDVVFNETFYGYSPRTHHDASTIVRYLALILGSKLAVWMSLVTSGEFGFEREVIEKATLDRIPIPDFDATTPSQRKEAVQLFEGLRMGHASWDEVDAWVARLYGLGERDLQVISDTLAFNLPFAENKRQAQQVPSTADKARFCDVLAGELAPWCQRFGTSLTVTPMPLLEDSPWSGIAVQTSPARESIPKSDWAGMLHAADETASSEVLLHTNDGGLLIGRLAQQRYWSDTQARLLAQHIIWSHLDVLKGLARV